MKTLLVIIACFLSLGLSACDSGKDPEQTADTDTTTTTTTTQKKSVFDGYVQDVNKAKDVQKKVDAAQKKLKAKIEQAEAGN